MTFFTCHEIDGDWEKKVHLKTHGSTSGDHGLKVTFLKIIFSPVMRTADRLQTCQEALGVFGIHCDIPSANQQTNFYQQRDERISHKTLQCTDHASVWNKDELARSSQLVCSRAQLTKFSLYNSLSDTRCAQ